MDTTRGVSVGEVGITIGVHTSEIRRRNKNNFAATHFKRRMDTIYVVGAESAGIAIVVHVSEPHRS